MTQWTHIQLQRRLQHEMTTLGTEKGRRRLSDSVRIVEEHLTATSRDNDVDDWIATLRVLETALTALGRRYGTSTARVTGG